MNTTPKVHIVGGFALVLGMVSIVGALYAAPVLFPVTYESTTAATSSISAPKPSVAEADASSKAEKSIPMPAFVSTPEPLKAIYMSQCVVGTPSFRADLVSLIEDTELNALVIDIKDYTGKLSFSTAHQLLQESVSDECGATDMAAFITQLHAKGIYVIGRITVFQDPWYATRHPEVAVKKASDPQAVWSDGKGLHFIDVSARAYWEYIVQLSVESRVIGFDELNYDYVRFPSDGPMSDILFPHTGTTPKPEALERFFAYLATAVKDPSRYPRGITPPATSVDIFGMTTTATTDMNIGQYLESALPHFDFVAPMVYPSHYPPGFNGWSNPNDYPGELITHVMSEAVVRAEATETKVKTLSNTPITKEIVVPATASTPTTTQKVATGMYTHTPQNRLKLRAWLQDFDYGGEYGPAEVRAQIQGTYDAGLTSWMLWAPSNRYTKEALGL
jgi:hypothetical protein